MKWRSWLLVAGIAVVLIALLAFIKYSQITSAIAFAQSFPEPSETVVEASAVESSWQRRFSTIGELRAPQTLEVKTEFGGKIAELGFVGGSHVEAGQLLVKLDDRDQQAELSALEARARLATLTLQRNEALASNRAASRQAADEAKAQLNVIEAQARGLRVVVDKKTLRAPFAGTTTLHQLQPGQYLDAGTSVTWLVGDGNEYWVDFSLPQELAANQVADLVQIRLNDAAPWLSAKIIAREPYVESASRDTGFRALLVTDDPAIQAGAAVELVATVGQTDQVITVPATGLRQDIFGAHVFVLVDAEAGADAPFRAVRKNVELLEKRDGKAYLSSGLSPGERVAADGAFKLRDGILVHTGKP
ncbi:MAG: efflux RND transporter periplasmic adaptor subunit [Pseudomonadota bacterium]